MKKLTRITITILILAFIATQAVVIFIANTTAGESIDATKLRAQVEELQDKNIELEAQVLAFSSYNTVASKAAELGYTENKNIVSVFDPVPLALK